MSTLANWSYTATLTVWPPSSYDEYGQPTFGTPYTLTGDWKLSTEARKDDSGTEFLSNSVYYFELAEDSALIPAKDGYIMKGDVTGTADPIAAGAEKIRKVSAYNMTAFGSTQLPDWEVVT